MLSFPEWEKASRPKLLQFGKFHRSGIQRPRPERRGGSPAPRPGGLGLDFQNASAVAGRRRAFLARTPRTWSLTFAAAGGRRPRRFGHSRRPRESRGPFFLPIGARKRGAEERKDKGFIPERKRAAGPGTHPTCAVGVCNRSDAAGLRRNGGAGPGTGDGTAGGGLATGGPGGKKTTVATAVVPVTRLEAPALGWVARLEESSHRIGGWEEVGRDRGTSRPTEGLIPVPDACPCVSFSEVARSSFFFFSGRQDRS